jgi:hypothetical protein
MKDRHIKDSSGNDANFGASMRLERSSGIDLKGWTFIDDDPEWLNKKIQKTLRRVFAEQPPEIGFACPADDLACLYLCLPLGSGESFDENVYWKVPLEAVVTGWINSMEACFDTPAGRAESMDYYAGLRDALRSASDLLDRKIQECQP